MYFRGWIHSWTCGNCPDADSYWRLRAFWAGVKGKRSSYNPPSSYSPPKRCPSGSLWRVIWMVGYYSDEDTLEF